MCLWILFVFVNTTGVCSNLGNRGNCWYLWTLVVFVDTSGICGQLACLDTLGEAFGDFEAFWMYITFIRAFQVIRVCCSSLGPLHTQTVFLVSLGLGPNTQSSTP